MSLAHLQSSITDSPISSSVYCLILDCTSSYPVPNSQDHLLLLKVTDESLYPDHANIQLFHQPATPVPKVASYGDIMRLQNCHFKLYKGVLTGTISAQSKSSKFTLYSLYSDDLTPYGLYKCTFSPGLDHHRHMLSTRKWAKSRLIEGNLPVLTSSIPLHTAQNSECDVLARVYAKAYMGNEEIDPILLLIYDNDRATTMLVEKNRGKMVKWLQNGDTVRIRSVIFEENRLMPSIYTDILKIPSEIQEKQIGKFVEKEEFLEKIVHFLQPNSSQELISTLKSDFLPLKFTSFSEISHINPGEKVRLKAFIVNIFPQNPSEIRGYYCPQCRQYTHLEICPCGHETEVRCQVTLVLWDGKSSGEEELVRVVVQPREVGRFIGELEWKQACALMISPTSMIDLVVGVEDGHLVLTGTRLKPHFS